jgi:uncharacterized protein YuzE
MRASIGLLSPPRLIPQVISFNHHPMNSPRPPATSVRGLGTPLRIRRISDCQNLVGKRVCVNGVVSVVKDLSDTGQYLILLKNSSAGEDVRVPLSSIELIEVVDDNPSFTIALKGAATRQSKTTKRRGPRKTAIASSPPQPVPLRALYDPRTDSLYIRLSQSQRASSKAITPSATLDIDARSKPVGIEVIHAIECFGYAKPVLANLRFKIEFDEETDCLHLILPGKRAHATTVGNEGISFDHDENGRLAQINISAARSRLDLAELGI